MVANGIHNMTVIDNGVNDQSFAYISTILSYIFGDPHSWIQIFLASCFLFYGAYFVTLGRVSIDGHWKTHIYKYENQSIQTNHIYSKVRHPIYCGQNYMAIGTSIILDTMFCVLFPVMLVIFNSKRATREELELSRMNNIDYSSYKRNVPFGMWYPFL